MPHHLNERPKAKSLGAAPAESSANAWHPSSQVALVLSGQPADARSRQAAFLVILVSAAIFIALAPFAKHKLGAYPVFIPLNQTALIINDVITALLLFMQLRVTRSRALLVLACGYLFTALMASAHLLTFPGVFTPTGLLGAGAQTTAYLFVIWHSGFPLAVMAYMFLKRRAADRVDTTTPRVAVPVTTTALLAVGFILLATGGNHLLPPILDGQSYSSEFNIGRYGQWVLTAAAIAVMWRSKSESVLDLWLVVALCASFIEIGLVAIFNAGRYDVGFYAGRVYALMSSVLVLAVLLFEQARMYSGVFASRVLQRAEAEARESRDVLRLAMAGGGMGAWSLDLISGKVWVSVELENMLGIASNNYRATLRALLKRFHRADMPRLRHAITAALSSGQDFAVEARFCGPGRTWQWLDVRGRTSTRQQGGAAALIGVAIDVTAQHKVQAALRENDRRKDEFLAVLAHELRNPLAPIRNAVRLLGMQGALQPEIERVRVILDRQSTQLSRLVEDLLDVSRITQGKVRLRVTLVSIGEVLRDAIDATAPAAEAAKQQVTVEMGEENLYTEADAGRLTQVFVNLLNNATKFTPPRGRIVVTQVRHDNDAVISIKDSGIGIKPEHLDGIFGIFSQVSSSQEPGHGGLGIGLALVRGFVELHGGSVTVYSEGAGRGTEFTVRLPLREPAVLAGDLRESQSTVASSLKALKFTKGGAFQL
jgi:signal transduction histidine kinase